MDDIVDAICLAVTSNIAAQGYYEMIPEIPMQDETGLLMQMVIPCFDQLLIPKKNIPISKVNKTVKRKTKTK